MNDAIWVGWCWDAALGEWLSICDAIEMGDCHRLLIASAEAHGVPMVWTGLTGGAPPRWKVK